MDLRGFGESDRPYSGYSYNRMADDLYRILNSIDSRAVTLCGFSMGGAVCLRYMARHCGYKVARLVLMGAAAPSLVQRPGQPYGMSVQQMDNLISKAYNNRPQLCAAFLRKCFAANPGQDYLSWMQGICTGAAGWATVQCAEALRDEDLRGDLQRVRVPTAIFHGVQDQICPYSLAEELRRGIRDSFLIPFENSGHALFYEERDKCNANLLEFINGL